MSVYADTSFLVSMLLDDEHTPAADRYLATSPALRLSTWSRAEFGAAIGARARNAGERASAVWAAQHAFEAWCAISPPAAAVTSDDVVRAGALVLRRELKLRAPDALHLAIVQRLRCGLVSFDAGMKTAAALLGIKVDAI